FDSRYHVRPPLRSEADRKALIAGIQSGEIDAIVSQHQPHDCADKQAPLAATEPGLSTIDSDVSLGLDLVDRGELSRARLLTALTSGPARIVGLSPELVEGAVADICVFDPSERWQPSAQTLVSSGLHAPVLGRDLPGRVRLTLVNGRA